MQESVVHSKVDAFLRSRQRSCQSNVVKRVPDLSQDKDFVISRLERHFFEQSFTTDPASICTQHISNAVQDNCVIRFVKYDLNVTTSKVTREAQERIQRVGRACRV